MADEMADDVIKQLSLFVRLAQEAIDQAIAERDALRAFAKECVLEAFRYTETEGMQELALEHGLLEEFHPDAPCGIDCQCEQILGFEAFADEDVICFRPTALLLGEKKRHE
jgi:hypothetical protein